MSSSVPFCIENLQRELGLGEVGAHADGGAGQLRTESVSRERAEERLSRSPLDRVRADTGEKLLYAQVWLPKANARKPILDEKKDTARIMEREEAVNTTPSAFDERDSTKAKPVKYKDLTVTEMTEYSNASTADQSIA